jgi:hypothetical protein
MSQYVLPVNCYAWHVIQIISNTTARTVGKLYGTHLASQTVLRRSCDRPSRHRFYWFPSGYKQMLKLVPKLPVGTACFSCIPSRLKFCKSKSLYSEGLPYLKVMQVTIKTENQNPAAPVSGHSIWPFWRLRLHTTLSEGQAGEAWEPYNEQCSFSPSE